MSLIIDEQFTLTAELKSEYQSRVIEYARELLQFESVTPDDAGCQAWIAKKLSMLGAKIDTFESHGVSNLIAVISNGDGPDLGFCGHTDVVPAGNLNKWQAPPFAGKIKNDYLIGRGIADMKGGIAAALVAAEMLVLEGSFVGRLWFLITSDEEGDALFGSCEIVKHFKDAKQDLDYCIVGEPTSIKQCGDMLKIGRRGALSFAIQVNGKSAHVAYPTQGINAIHHACSIVKDLMKFDWDNRDSNQLGTTMQVTHIDSGLCSDNVIPDAVIINLNIRYTTAYSEDDLIHLVTHIVTRTTNDFSLTTSHACNPYYSAENSKNKLSLIKECKTAINQCTGLLPQTSTAGGTSDGRFFSDICPQVVELGLTNGTIHQENERVHISELGNLTNIYFTVFKKLLSNLNTG
ncbi:succinyl-diaminopimelate desuccinylase [Pseudoalteromonas sp. B131b]|uniref:succinyl-diaminopimelate desuccinylase n=1 Tax=Pseudoalteromonas TaxID=53246 RepID=UPI000BBF1B92|nr:succinyl-diaminopimelate desuccinylase [Pseudoalteromonas sp. 1_2015MBL_MicDiv]ATG79402.1 succinyl-diaminopimelate desuccinylase [Pseudoalteromonas sp. 1_2015MBL_MicDiv]